MADEKSGTKSAIDLAFDDHMKTLFADYVRHMKGNAIEDARREFRKNISIARQARGEMVSIATESADG